MVRVIRTIIMVGLLGALMSGCSMTVTIVPVDEQQIVQKTLGNQLWDWAFDTKKKVTKEG